MGPTLLMRKLRYIWITSFALSKTFLRAAAFSPRAFMQMPITTAVNTTARMLLFVLKAEVMLLGTAFTITPRGLKASIVLAYPRPSATRVTLKRPRDLIM